MYSRLYGSKVNEAFERFSEDRLFQMLSPVLRTLSIKYEELTPVEVWDESLGITERMKNSKSRRDVYFDQICSELLQKYLCFVDERGKEKTRTTEDAQRTTDIVLTVVTFMLMRSTKDEKGNPHQKILNKLRDVLHKSEIANIIIVKAEQNETAEEQDYGEIPEFDYMCNEYRSMFDKIVQGGAVDEGCIDIFDSLVNEILSNTNVVRYLQSKKTLNNNYHAKGVLEIIGLLLQKHIIKGSANHIGTVVLKVSNGNKYLASQNSEMSEDLIDEVKAIIDKYRP